MQYFSGVNQVRCGHNSSHVEHFQATPRMAFQPIHVEKGFASLSNTFHAGDEIKLHLPRTVTVHESPDHEVYFDYGPLLLALKMQEDWQVDTKELRQTADFPAYHVEPKSEWRYAVTGKELPELTCRDHSENPWWDGTPMTFTLTAYKLPEWDFVRKSSVHRVEGEGVCEYEIPLGATMVYDDLIQTPPLPETVHLRESETIVLIPYGCTNLRIALFPRCIP